MAQTKRMRADDMANAFNGVLDRKYWRAAVAGTRVFPEVHFNSRASMVQIVFRIATEDFSVVFSKANASFGDFLASAHRSLEQVLTSLKAAGLPFADVLESCSVLRLEYDPRGKTQTVHMAFQGDDWELSQPMPFKVPERNSLDNSLSELDPL